MICAHAAELEKVLVCLEYGGYVFLYSSCGFLERREKGLPVVREGGDLRDVRTGTRRPDRTGGVTSLLAPSVASW
jgi:hypothetical protein